MEKSTVYRRSADSFQAISLISFTCAPHPEEDYRAQSEEKAEQTLAFLCGFGALKVK